MSAKTAYMWIRDGVLINRMHVNPVAFAVAYYLYLPKFEKHAIDIETLINFGFEKSGYSCLEKMKLFNEEHGASLVALDAAVACYNALAGAAGEECNYFDFAPELLGKLQSDGCKNYITSALEQSILDEWIKSQQGLVIKDSIDELLGKRDGFSKGVDHFSLVSKQINGGRIFYIADAVSEIATGAKYASEFNITTVGFAYHINVDAVEQAYSLIESLLELLGVEKELPALRKEQLRLPEPLEIVDNLKNAGASAVVTGSAESIMANLSTKLKGI
jgi:hypothetical protein